MIVGPTANLGVELIDQIGGRYPMCFFDDSSDALQELRRFSEVTHLRLSEVTHTHTKTEKSIRIHTVSQVRVKIREDLSGIPTERSIASWPSRHSVVVKRKREIRFSVSHEGYTYGVGLAQGRLLKNRFDNAFNPFQAF